MASPSDLIVITSAAGQQCSHLIPLLYGRYRLRLIAHSDGGASALRAAYPDAEVEQADLLEPSQCRRALRGAAACYHVGPSMHPHETQLGYNMVDAAEFHLPGREKAPAQGGSGGSVEGTGTFRHFVYSSVLNTQLRKLMNHDCKRYVEEYLYESALDYTVLKPSDFLDMAVPAKALQLQSEAAHSATATLPWHVGLDQDVQNSYMVLGDLAEAAARVLAERQPHFLAEYPLVSTAAPVSRREIAARLSAALGRQVRCEEAPDRFGAGVDHLLGLMFGDAAGPRRKDVAERLVLTYNRRGLRGNSNVLRWLLGREPTSLDQWIDREIKRDGDAPRWRTNRQ